MGSRRDRAFVFAASFTAALIGAGVATRADAAPDHPAEAGGASAGERQKLRADLDRVNAAIDALKQQPRGIRDDYRLRARMADAEALARRLTELDARAARTATPAPAMATGTWPAAPQPSPSDDRADLEAKADILSDQAHRLSTQADLLAHRVTDLQRRQELRRRAGQLERDPFSPLEQAKRRVATSSQAPVSAPRDPRPSFGVGTDSPSAGSQPAAGSHPATPTITTTPASPASGSVGAGASLAPSTGSQGVAGHTNDATGSSSVASAQTLVAPVGADAPTSLAAQFRDILDAGTVAEIRKLEQPGSASGNLQALERALVALRARAAELDARAGTLRTQARATH